jgi:hypothetical protein
MAQNPGIELVAEPSRMSQAYRMARSGMSATGRGMSYAGRGLYNMYAAAAGNAGGMSSSDAQLLFEMDKALQWAKYIPQGVDMDMLMFVRHRPGGMPPVGSPQAIGALLNEYKAYKARRAYAKKSYLGKAKSAIRRHVPRIAKVGLGAGLAYAALTNPGAIGDFASGVGNVVGPVAGFGWNYGLKPTLDLGGNILKYAAGKV